MKDGWKLLGILISAMGFGLGIVFISIWTTEFFGSEFEVVRYRPLRGPCDTRGARADFGVFVHLVVAVSSES